jgi:hypothetical protein
MTSNDIIRESKRFESFVRNSGRKNSLNSNSSRDTYKSQLWEILDGYVGLDLLPDPMFKRSYEIIQTKLHEDRIREAPNDYILRMRKEEIFEPFRKLGSYLFYISLEVDSEWLKDTLDSMVEKAFTVRTIRDEFFHMNQQMEVRDKKRTQRLIKKLEKVGILASKITGSERNGIPYNRKLRDVRYYYIPDYHSERDKEKGVFDVYRKDALGIGRPEDKIKPLNDEEKAEQKIQSQIVLEEKKLEQKLLEKTKREEEERSQKSFCLKCNRDITGLEHFDVDGKIYCYRCGKGKGKHIIPKVHNLNDLQV